MKIFLSKNIKLKKEFKIKFFFFLENLESFVKNNQYLDYENKY